MQDLFKQPTDVLCNCAGSICCQTVEREGAVGSDGQYSYLKSSLTTAVNYVLKGICNY